MRHSLQHIFLFLGLIASTFAFVGCQADGNYPGSDYMPDMGPSLAYEANYHIDHESSYLKFSQRKFTKDSTYYKYTRVKEPVKGTIPRGYAGFSNKSASELADLKADMIDKPLNGYAPYGYANTEAGRDSASTYLSNPYPVTNSGIANGKAMWTTYCQVCHGKTMEGNGVIYENGAYPAAPSNLTQDEYKTSADGRFYHTIYHGKGVMGSYKDKMSEKERWDLVHYIRSQQFGKNYSANALDNSTVDFDKVLHDKTGQGIALENVFFRTGSAELTTASIYELDRLVSALRRDKGVSLELGGHTDNTGAADANTQLSKDRANSVLSYLVSQGVSSSRLSAQGYGSSAPRAENSTVEGRQKNRRVNFVIK